VQGDIFRGRKTEWITTSENWIEPQEK